MSSFFTMSRVRILMLIPLGTSYPHSRLSRIGGGNLERSAKVRKGIWVDLSKDVKEVTLDMTDQVPPSLTPPRLWFRLSD